MSESKNYPAGTVVMYWQGNRSYLMRLDRHSVVDGDSLRLTGVRLNKQTHKPVGATRIITVPAADVSGFTSAPAAGVRPLLWLRPVTPDVAVGVDDGLCVVLVTTEGKGPRWSIGSVDSLKSALDAARDYVTIREAVMADHKDSPSAGEAIMARYEGAVAR
jgi:hypothetical protein